MNLNFENSLGISSKICFDLHSPYKFLLHLCILCVDVNYTLQVFMFAQNTPCKLFLPWSLLNAHTSICSKFKKFHNYMKINRMCLCQKCKLRCES